MPIKMRVEQYKEIRGSTNYNYYDVDNNLLLLCCCGIV